jgi:hypothetical protein
LLRCGHALGNKAEDVKKKLRVLFFLSVDNDNYEHNEQQLEMARMWEMFFIIRAYY